MPKANRPIRHEEIQAGEFVWLATDVDYGDDGIRGLKHFIALPQGGWHFQQDDFGHILQHVFDTAASRLCWRQASVSSGAKRSYMRGGFILPADFGSFISVTFKTRRSVVAATSYLMSLLFDGAADPTAADVDVLPVASGDYYIWQVVPSGTYSPGDFCVLQFDLLTSAADVWAEVSDIELAYRTARGNI